MAPTLPFDHGDHASRLIYWHVTDAKKAGLPAGTSSAWVKRSADGVWRGVDAATSAPIECHPSDGWAPWDEVLDDSAAPLYHWFAGGTTNSCFQNVDKHLVEGRGSEIAYSFMPEEGDPGWPATTQRVTRRQLAIAVAKASDVLVNRHKLGSSSRVLFHMPTCVEQMAWVLACQRNGIMYTCTSVEHPVDALAYRMTDARPDLLICGNCSCQNGGREIFCNRTLERVCTDKSKIIEVPCGGMFPAEDAAYVGLSDAELLKKLWTLAPVVPVGASHPLFVSYTSGSTGKPKGVVHVHGGYMYGIALSMEVVFEIPSDAPSKEVLLTIGTTGWITGQSYMIAGPLVSGTTAVLLGGSPVYPQLIRFAKAIESEKVTILKTGSALVRQLVSSQAASKLKKLDLSSLKWGTFCAEPVSLDAQEFAVRHLCKNFMNSYWATEHGGIVFSRPLDQPIRPDTRTYPLPWVVADVDAPPNVELGDIAIREPYPYLIHTVLGDLDNFGKPEWQGDVARLKRTYWPKDYFLQGDNARICEDGGFSFHGRSDEVLNINGVRVGTEEIEAQVWSVAEGPVACEGVAVVGAPDHIKGMTPVAFVQLKSPPPTGGDTESERQAISNTLLTAASRAIRDNIGTHAVLSSIFVLSQIPKTHTGKVARKTLQLLLAGESNPDRSSLKNPESIDEVGAAVQRWLTVEANSSTRIELEKLFETYGIDGHVVLGQPIMPGTGCLSAIFGNLCHSNELVGVHFLKPVECTKLVTILKRGRHASAIRDDVVLFKAELGDDVAAGESPAPIEPGAVFPTPPAKGKSWEGVTERRDKTVHYARCTKLQLQYTNDFVTLDTVEWRGLEFWGEGTSRHLPAALDAGMQIICSFSGANTYIPFRVRRFRLERQADSQPHWNKNLRLVTSGVVLAVDNTKITANVRVEIPDAGYVGIFYGAEFAKVGSLLPEPEHAQPEGGTILPKNLRTMPLVQRKEMVEKVIASAARAIMSKDMDASKSLVDNGMHSLDQMALLTRVNEALQVNLSVKDWGDQDDPLSARMEAVSHALATASDNFDPFANIDRKGPQEIINEQVRVRSWSEYISNPQGPKRPGYWLRAANLVLYSLRVGPLGRARAATRNGLWQFLSNPPLEMKFDEEVTTDTKEVTIKRTDLNRHFTVREIIKASEDGFNSLLHKTGIAHLEHFFGRMFYSSAIKAKFVKEMPIHSFSRTHAKIIGVRGPLIDVSVQFFEVHEDGSQGELTAEVLWTLLMVVSIEDKLVYNWEVGLTDELKRHVGMLPGGPKPRFVDDGWNLLAILAALLAMLIGFLMYNGTL
eukprot:m.30066 g.30066  ORF g.30066 m.30066 type:complete len:1308 (+) comp4662_c0_seq1:287-4210(+)